MEHELFKQPRHSWPSSVAIPSKSGLYAIYLKESFPNGHPPLPDGFHYAGALLYIGKTINLEERITGYFAKEYSGFSSVKRSIGALLKDKLNLTAIPRKDGNTSEHCFTLDGERDLNNWMQHCLKYQWIEEEYPKGAEEKLIAHCTPLLNIDGNRNQPLVPRLRKLRDICKEEAKRKSKEKRIEGHALFDEPKHEWLSPVSIPETAGLCAIYLKEALPQGCPTLSDEFYHLGELLYIGASGNLRRRLKENHFESSNSSSSTLRRSLGALLKGKLKLTAIPRTRYPKEPNDTKNYKFNNEEYLSEWMQHCLEYQWIEEKNYNDAKKRLIDYHKPPLNIAYNSHRIPSLKRARDACKKEAEDNIGNPRF